MTYSRNDLLAMSRYQLITTIENMQKQADEDMRIRTRMTAIKKVVHSDDKKEKKNIENI